MARYRKVDPRIWNDEKFRKLSVNGKLVFLFILTHPHMTALGAMRATIDGLAQELRWLPEDFRKAFREGLREGLFEHDPKACLVWLPNFLKYNLPESPNVVRAWAGAAELLPECPLKNLCISRAKQCVEGFGKGFNKAFGEAFAKSMPKSMPYQEQEQEQDLIPPLPPKGGNGLRPREKKKLTDRAARDAFADKREADRLARLAEMQASAVPAPKVKVPA